MIPVTRAQPPANFEDDVRKPGLAWLAAQGIAADQPPPDAAKMPPHWQKTSKALWDAYNGTCAYLAIYFAWPLGAHSTEHFVAKSRNSRLAYEWSNYRLTCLGANRRKNRFDDVLDPFEIEADTFVLNLASGKISPNPAKPDVREQALKTIERLGLDDPEMDRMRAGHYTEFLQEDVSAGYLQRNSPFVWYEANRQGLL